MINLFFFLAGLTIAFAATYIVAMRALRASRLALHPHDPLFITTKNRG